MLIRDFFNQLSMMLHFPLLRSQKIIMKLTSMSLTVNLFKTSKLSLHLMIPKPVTPLGQDRTRHAFSKFK